ncbi:MAG: hypothetical protein U0Z44_02985 [Kouleothrix sp.]
MTYRGMTEGELQAFVREFRAFQIWREYTGFARDIYGVAAERVEVTTIAERNLGNSYLVIDAVHVYDARRRPLEPDLSTAWWQAMVCEYFPDDELYDDDAHEDWLSTMVGERQAACRYVRRVRCVPGKLPTPPAMPRCMSTRPSRPWLCSAMAAYAWLVRHDALEAGRARACG